MATLRDIRKKLKAIQSTKKITAAMKMVAAAKLRKVQDRMLNFRPYAKKMETVLSNLAKVSEREMHPLLALRPRKNVEVIVITSDRGLCGAFNSNILKAASVFIKETMKENVELTVSTVGRKSRDFFRRRDIKIRKSWVGLSGRITFADAQEISKDIIENYVDEKIDEFVIVSSEFRSLLVQQPSVLKLLPMGSMEEEGKKDESAETVDMLYEPSMDTIFERLLPKHIEIQVYRALIETSASEEAARMTAMENATKNCSELITKVTLLANKVRQAAITKDLMDIVGGVEALK
jgi:F-type H+-transporting ATPase subunit gamma